MTIMTNQKIYTMKNDDYPYYLEPSGNGRIYNICPSCGKAKFTLYVRADTGDYIDQSVGRCERINNCGYHKTPSQYYEENNIYPKNYKTMKNEQQILDLSQKAPEKEALWDETTATFEKQNFVGCIDESKLRKFKYGNSEPDYCANALFVYLCSVFGYEKTLEAFKLYDIHTTYRYMLHGLSGTAFFYRYKNTELNQVKECAYNSKTGRRCKDGDAVLVRGKGGMYQERVDGDKILHTEKYIMGDDYTPKQTLFGGHLLEQYSHKPCALVESEKSAIVCSICDPSFVWLATGGMNAKINACEVYGQLQSRDITFFPDLGATNEWEVAASKMSYAHINVKIFDLAKADFVEREDINKGLDIADYFIKAYKAKYPNAGEDVRQRLNVEKSTGSQQMQSMFSVFSATPASVEVSTPEVVGQPIESNDSTAGVNISFDDID